MSLPPPVESVSSPGPPSILLLLASPIKKSPKYEPKIFSKLTMVSPSACPTEPLPVFKLILIGPGALA